MDYTLVIGLLVVLVVGFFGYQWMMKRPAVPRPGKAASLPSASATAAVAAAATASASAPSQEAPSLGPRYPDIPGQTQAEALTKEPLQRREPSSQQAPVTNNGDAPAQFDQHLRHPEQLFHQPSDTPVSMQGSDLGSGRASSQSTPLGPAPGGAGQQGFSPEMAQNGGAFLGNSVFAFDGMEPTGFTSF
jgi:hypothetical protein